MPAPLTIVVTGSNRGIGQGIIHLLSKTQHPRPLTIYATSRSGTALSISAIPPNEIHYAKLDITSIASINAFLRTTLPETGKIDVLINNAGINNNKNETADTAAQTIDVNYHSTKTICKIFLHEGKMKDTQGARIVNVSSTASALSNYPASTQSRFHSVKTVSDINVLADKYVSSVRSNSQEAAGFGAPPKSYQVSKALVNALTVVLARENEEAAEDVGGGGEDSG
ncbi:FabG, Dehydrogenase (short-chain alcohol dehydrogenase) [Pyrenophora tritici-repentis]|nr:FabG Dehydrogenase [Pyrenophora tritici-repentis]KAF7569126.1 FabG, Dehydrogenase with different specificities (related to short-chain alcohol dehydrogenase) [Pyrenophora tritici-repentis]KAI1544097.1 Short-chain alcohol dehydrogenase [Pyrenophora tritici-repentis]KAI1576595.1 Short-chain alcohol dehydrogenase [Pyrenophora tritici-repentis]KAI1586854.1 Short-chain alcohol dehydrogenase [Pyrenophora tritici-repentis]